MFTATNRNAATVSPEEFAQAMRNHWQDSLGNTPSPSLMALWETMGKTFNAAIESDGTRWSVLQPPTGTGKTQGLSVFAAFTAKANRDVRSDKNGILIVTRRIEQAEELKETINHIAGFECAFTKHSEIKITPEMMRQADILIITHAAYGLALEGLCQQDGSRWSDLIEWDHGKRCLTVIDEALANVIDEHQVKASDIRQVLSNIDADMKAQYSEQVDALKAVESVLDKIAELNRTSSEEDDKNRSRVVWREVADGRVGFPAGLSMRPLRDTMSGLRYDQIVLRKDLPLDRQRLAGHIDKTLGDVESILSKWAYYAKKGTEHTFNASRLLIPNDLPAPVVLDATAKQNFLWELLGDRADIKPIPPNTRSYRNATLHVARVSRTGKGAMIDEGQTRIPRLLENLETTLVGTDRRVFLCVHKDIEHIALKYAPKFDQYSVGHWGAVDGRNDWKDHDIAVIFGLPYRNHIWATNAFFALQGLQDNDWLRNPQWKSYTDVRDEMQIKQVTVSVVQAINRIQCRRVIDEAGNCPKSDVFILLPTGSQGDRILDAIKLEMPNIQVQPWSFNPDGKKVKVRSGSCHEPLISFMSNRMPGETSMTIIKRELGLKDKTIKNLKETLRDTDHPLTVGLKEIGVSLVSSGYGRGSKSYLLKT